MMTMLLLQLPYQARNLSEPSDFGWKLICLWTAMAIFVAGAAGCSALLHLACKPGYDVMEEGPLRAASAAAFSASILATTSSTSVSASSLSPA